MVPSPLVALDHLPLNSSGKIDRRALAARPLPESSAAPVLSAADPLARELAAIWGDILECHGVGVDDDFFALGGHSLAAARLVSEVARRTGITVPLDWLFDRPTPAGMAERMREKAAVDLAEPRVIPLSRGHGGRPLFWCHTLVDGGMGLLPYRETARLLGDVADSHGIAEGTRSFGSIADMADAHIAKIRAVQPLGPYRLAGFCFGGNLAAEVAARLADHGQEIELLCLLESSPPLPAAPGSNPWLRPATWGRFLSRLPARLRSLMARDSLQALRRLKMKHRAAGSLLRRDGIPDIRGVLDLDLLDPESQDRAERHWQALHLHIPRLPAARRIVLVRAEEDGWLPRPATLGWKSKTRIEVLKVPGCHEDFLRQHSATEVAQVLRQVLRG
jgi:thioesterase domain-containing protein